MGYGCAIPLFLYPFDCCFALVAFLEDEPGVGDGTAATFLHLGELGILGALDALDELIDGLGRAFGEELFVTLLAFEECCFEKHYAETTFFKEV